LTMPGEPANPCLSRGLLVIPKERADFAADELGEPTRGRSRHEATAFLRTAAAASPVLRTGRRRAAKGGAIVPEPELVLKVAGGTASSTGQAARVADGRRAGHRSHHLLHPIRHSCGPRVRRLFSRVGGRIRVGSPSTVSATAYHWDRVGSPH